MTLWRFTPRILLLALLGFSSSYLYASTVNETGTFSADNSVYQYNFTASGTQNYTFETTSYASGGFVPILTLFNSTGTVVGFDGADGGICNGAETPDPSTGICNDAFLQETLSGGAYTLDLTEFPNELSGDGSGNFLFADDPTATGDFCGVTGGMFLEADLAPCVQRTNQFALTITSTHVTPEPSTFLLFLPIAAGLIAVSRRRFI